MSLAAAMVRGSGWQVLSTLSTTVGQLGIAVVLARLLAPADFGVVAIGFAATELLTVLGEYGAAAAVARSHPPTRTLVRTAVGRTVWRGALLLLVAVVIGWGVERGFAMPYAMRVIVALAAGSVITNVGLVLQAIAEASLDFRRVAMVDALAYWVGALVVSVPLAWLGAGHWALVAGFAVQGAVRVMAHAPLWRGLPAAASDAASGQAALGRFGASLTLARLLNAGVNQLDKVVLGRASSAATVGLYARPMLLVTQMGTAAGAVYDRVLYPVFARLANRGDAALADHFLRALAFIGLLMAPLACFVAVEASDVVLLLFGAQWTGAGEVLRWGVLAMPALAVVRTCDTLARAVGRPERTVRLKAVYLILLVPAVLVGVRGGPGALAAAMAIAAWVMAVVQASDAVRTAGGTHGALGPVLWRAMPFVSVLCLVVAVAAEARQRYLPLPALLALIASGAAATAGGAVALRVDARAGGTRALAWLLDPFRAQLPPRARRLIGMDA